MISDLLTSSPPPRLLLLLLLFLAPKSLFLLDDLLVGELLLLLLFPPNLLLRLLEFALAARENDIILNVLHFPSLLFSSLYIPLGCYEIQQQRYRATNLTETQRESLPKPSAPREAVCLPQVQIR